MWKLLIKQQILNIKTYQFTKLCKQRKKFFSEKLKERTDGFTSVRSFNFSEKKIFAVWDV